MKRPGARPRRATDEQSNHENKRQFHGYLKDWTTDHGVGQQLGLARSTPGFRTVMMQGASVGKTDRVGQLRSGR